LLERKPTGIRKADAFDGSAVRAVCHPVRARIARWVADHLDEIAEARPERPAGLNDRQWNNWRPLLAIASVVGEKWSAMAAEVARRISGAVEEDDDLGPLLLEHLRMVFQQQGDPDFLTTETILKALVENDAGPWGKWWHADGDGGWRGPASHLARMLGAFHDARGKRIRSRQRRVKDPLGTEGNHRVYERAAFEAAWGSYAVPAQKDATDATPQAGATSAAAIAATAATSPDGPVQACPACASSCGRHVAGCQEEGR
jgi:hypothetical protein